MKDKTISYDDLEDTPKKIEKISDFVGHTTNEIIDNIYEIKDKLNKIIDYINNGKGCNELQQRIDNAEKYIYELKKKWLASSIKNNTSLYEFETYIGGMSKLIKINNILEGEDKKND